MSIFIPILLVIRPHDHYTLTDPMLRDDLDDTSDLILVICNQAWSITLKSRSEAIPELIMGQLLLPFNARSELSDSDVTMRHSVKLN